MYKCRTRHDSLRVHAWPRRKRGRARFGLCAVIAERKSQDQLTTSKSAACGVRLCQTPEHCVHSHRRILTRTFGPCTLCPCQNGTTICSREVYAHLDNISEAIRACPNASECFAILRHYRHSFARSTGSRRIAPPSRPFRTASSYRRGVVLRRHQHHIVFVPAGTASIAG